MKDRLDEARANLDAMRTAAFSVAGIAAVVLALASGGPVIPQVLLLGSLVTAMLAVLPRLHGDHGVVAWARGDDGAPDEERLRWIAARTVGGWRWVRGSVILFLAGMAVGVAVRVWTAVT